MGSSPAAVTKIFNLYFNIIINFLAKKDSRIILTQSEWIWEKNVLHTKSTRCYFEFRNYLHWVKSVRIRSFSGPYFPAFGQNTERLIVSLCIQSKCGKIRTRKTQHTATFHAVLDFWRILYNWELQFESGASSNFNITTFANNPHKKVLLLIHSLTRMLSLLDNVLTL